MEHLHKKMPSNPMFKHHTRIFATFHPDDSLQARRVIADLSRRCSERTFLGRHTIRTNAEAEAELSRCSLTIVLESRITYASSDVLHDIRVSQDKQPPNEILRILLTDDVNHTDAAVVRLTAAGVESTPCDMANILDAMERLDILAKEQPKLKTAAEAPSNGGSICVR